MCGRYSLIAEVGEFAVRFEFDALGLGQAPRYNIVSLFRINVRLGGQHKCHSVRLRWYQVMASRVPRGIAASEDSPCSCIS